MHTQLHFDFEALEGARNSFDKLKRKIIELKSKAKDEENVTNITVGKDYKDKFLEAISDDLNIPEALALLWNLVKEKELSAKEKLYLVSEFDKVLGLKLEEVKEDIFDIPTDVMELIRQREEARDNKDFAKSDELRQQIKEAGFEVSDTPKGPDVKRIK
jgi:cysteinyl-tRNA synthetase